ncbi:MAG: UDP-glucose/GDP-mannose dehydrogenase family protein [Alphaproteobacteria bacterium]|nr:UDP-glucose/GDP-mannose dehydrogenase family protein [Alphaproteobacteria bacterium]
MQIAMIGTGYVCLVTGACFSEFGWQVVCVDKDEVKIARLQAGEIPIHEPGLDVLVAKNHEAGRLSFTTDLGPAVRAADAVFIAVGTPSRRGDGEADLTYVREAAGEIAGHLDGYTVVVTKSTVPVGTSGQVEAILRECAPKADFDVVSNPEFLREGAAIEDFMRPDRVVIGAVEERARETMRNLYRPLFLNATPIVFTGIETAELTKYAANCFLATKITFINEIADLCEAVGADVQDVARGIGLDGRIGGKFLHAGPGYGGSCFPKDTRALLKFSQNAGAPISIVERVVDVNDARPNAMADKIVAACGGTVAGKTIAILGLTFKPNTDDMRDAPSVPIIESLQAAGATIQAYDPVGMNEAKKILDNVGWCDGAYDAIEGAAALVIVTEWNEFRALDLPRVAERLAEPVVVDLRNIYEPADMRAAGLDYHSVGRAPVRAGTSAGATAKSSPRRAEN